MQNTDFQLPENPTEIQLATLNTVIGARALTLIGMDPTQVDVLVRNKIIPTTVGRFMHIKGIWSDHIRAMVSQVSWQGDDLPLSIQYPHGRETFDEVVDGEIVGWTHYFDGNLQRNRYRADTGLTIQQALVDAETKTVHQVLYEVDYDAKGRVKEERQPVLINGEDGASMQETGTWTIERHFYNGQDVLQEHWAAEVEVNAKGKLPKLERDMFTKMSSFEYENGLMTKAIYPAPPPYGETVIGFEWDEQGNLTSNLEQGTVKLTVDNSYDEAGRLVSMVRNSQPETKEDGSQEVTVDTLYDFSAYWASPTEFTA